MAPRISNGERMAKLETEMKNTHEKIRDLKESGTENHKLVMKKLDDFIETAPQKFASKITEKLVYSCVALILIAFVTKFTGMW